MRPWSLLALAACSEFNIIPPPDFDIVPHELIPPSVVRSETFTQTTAPKVDVLFVVDNSSSMTEEATKLSVNFPKFLDYFLYSGLDWHVGVVSTNMEAPGHSGQLLAANGYSFIDTETVEPDAVFAAMVPYYPGVSHSESGRAAVYAALEVLVDGVNVGFLRDEAPLHIVIISDENDHSVSPPKDEFIDWLDDLRPDPATRSFSAITGLEICANSSEVGQEYIDVSNVIGGVLWSICTDDWAPVMDELGENASTLSTEFFLAEIPVIETIEVILTEPGSLPSSMAEGDDWTYNEVRNSITFASLVPSPLATVEILYETRR